MHFQYKKTPPLLALINSMLQADVKQAKHTYIWMGKLDGDTS